MVTHNRGDYKDKLAKAARESDHWGARQASMTPPKFARGDMVRIRKTGQVAKVAGEGNWGYTLEGYMGYFPSSVIERA